MTTAGIPSDSAQASAGVVPAAEAQGTGSMRREAFVEAARALYESQGLSRTTVKDITDSMGVARSLFYHYFSSKDAVTEAVLDSYVQDFLELVQNWNEARELHDIRGALHGCIRILRMGIFDNDSFRNDLISNENASLYLNFQQRAAEALAQYVTATTAEDYKREHGLRINHVYDTFYLLITGLIGYVRRYPDASDELLEDLIVQTLRMDEADVSLAVVPDES